MKATIRNEMDRERFIASVKAVKLKDGKVYSGEFKQRIKRRSVPQNSLYWVWLTAIVDQTDYGYTRDDWHEHYRGKFLPKKFVHAVPVPSSTKVLDSKQFSEYLERIYDDALVEHSCQLYWPGEEAFNEFYDHYQGKVA